MQTSIETALDFLGDRKQSVHAKHMELVRADRGENSKIGYGHKGHEMGFEEASCSKL